MAVLGAGVMGSRIAAHLANAGYPVLLLDLPGAEGAAPGETARRGLEAARRQSPPPFFTDAAAELVETGDYKASLHRLRECDWIIEAVSEHLPVKRQVLEMAASMRRPEGIVSTNTSGIPLNRIAEGFDLDFRRHFLGTHFFNPPRYLHLLELVSAPETLPEVLDRVELFCALKLGKGVVRAKDTPNFIANRIGAFFCLRVQTLAEQEGLTVEEADALTGPLIGLPGSATFRLLDIIGLDVWNRVCLNVYEQASGDPWREHFLPPASLRELLRRGWLGEKTGQGYYKRIRWNGRTEILALDLRTFEYRPMAKAEFPELGEVCRISDLPSRLRRLAQGGGRAQNFLWRIWSSLFAYAAAVTPEIAFDLADVDRSMRWGYGHRYGPFELWDLLGFESCARRMREEGLPLSDPVERMLEGGACGFYRPVDAARKPGMEVFDLAAMKYRKLRQPDGVLRLADFRRARCTVRENSGACLVDIGDGVLCLELRGENAVFGEAQTEMIFRAAEEMERDYEALVIGSEGEVFCSGHDWTPVLELIREGSWKQLEGMVHRRQQALLALKLGPKPVVAAPFARTLGPGCELMFHAHRVQAFAELYAGFPELSLGLLPWGGGCKEMLLRAGNARLAFERLASRRISGSADQARESGYLTNADGISMNPERHLGDAKALALALARTFRPVRLHSNIVAEGESMRADLKLKAWLMLQSGGIDDVEFAVLEKLAEVLAGGRLSGPQPMCETHFLELEREAFLSLCGVRATQERLASAVSKGNVFRV